MDYEALKSEIWYTIKFVLISFTNKGYKCFDIRENRVIDVAKNTLKTENVSSLKMSWGKARVTTQFRHHSCGQQYQQFRLFVSSESEIAKCFNQCRICLLWLRERERERNVLFNNALNTFYLRIYGVRHMVKKDHYDSEKGHPLPPHRLLLSINSKFFYMHHPTHRITHTTAFVTPVMEHWLEREIAQWAHPMKDRSNDPPHHERTLYLCYYGWRTDMNM